LTTTATEKSTHYVDLFAVSRRAGHCNPRQFRALIVDVAVNRANERTAPRSTTALLDSGAQVSGVDAGAVAKLFAWTALEPLGDDDPLLRAAGGSELVCTGKLRDVRVRVGEAWLAVPALHKEPKPTSVVIQIIVYRFKSKKRQDGGSIKILLSQNKTSLSWSLRSPSNNIFIFIFS
jgi:hypothetical protein